MGHDHDHAQPHAHGHSHGHGHQHGHGHGPGDFGRAFAIGVGLNLAFIVVEVAYGLISHSMALLADAGHNAGDVLSLAIAWGAGWLSQRQPSQRFTYGLRGSSILAALFNAILLLVVTGGIAWEAILRLVAPEPVAAGTVVWVAALGIGVNGLTALLFAAGRHGDVNIRGAFLHMAADAAVALGVAAAGLAIMATGWIWLDPLVSLGVSLVVVIGTWRLLADSAILALHAVPAAIAPDEVRRYLTGLAGVSHIHDLHIWPMSTTETALTCHLVMPAGYPGDGFLSGAAAALKERFGIAHVTLQVETGDPQHPCVLVPDHVV